MKTNLRNGVIPTPPSLEYALHRRRVLAGEIERIEGQLAGRIPVHHDPARLIEEWRNSAKSAIHLFRKEERQYLHWIEVAQNSLLRQCWEILRTTDERDLDADELMVLGKLNRLYVTPTPSLQLVRESSKE